MSDSTKMSQDTDWECEKESLLNGLEYARKRDRHTRRLWLLAISVVLLSNLVSTALTVKYYGAAVRFQYSPDFESSIEAYEGLDRSYSLVEFSEHHPNRTSKYSAPPSPAVDRAWLDIGARDKGFLLPKDVGRKLGLNPLEHMYDEPGEWGDNDLEGYYVFNQGFHDLHCLNELRRALYFNKGYYKQFEDDTTDPEWFRQSHINHCLDNIRERLMCTADIGVIPSVYTGPHKETIKFANKHKCHSYDALVEWKRKWEEDRPDFVKVSNAHEALPVTAPPGAIFYDP